MSTSKLSERNSYESVSSPEMRGGIVTLLLAWRYAKIEYNKVPYSCPPGSAIFLNPIDPGGFSGVSTLNRNPTEELEQIYYFVIYLNQYNFDLNVEVLKKSRV